MKFAPLCQMEASGRVSLAWGWVCAPGSQRDKEKAWTEKNRIFRSAGRSRRPKDGFRGDAAGGEVHSGTADGAARNYFALVSKRRFCKYRSCREAPGRRPRCGAADKRFATANPSYLGNLVNFLIRTLEASVRCAPLRCFSDKGLTRASQMNNGEASFGPGRASPQIQRRAEETKGVP